LIININGANSSISSTNHGTSYFQNFEKIIGGSGKDEITIDSSDLSVYTIEDRGGDDIVTGNGKSILSYEQNTTGISLDVNKGAGKSTSAGAGNDSFSNFTKFDGGLGSDTFTLTNNDKTEYTINGGGGQDTFLIANQNKATITGGSSLTDNDILSFTNNTSKVTININNGAGTALDADSGKVNFSNIKTFIGGSGESEFTVTSTDTNSYTLQGGNGINELTGGAGNDTLIGGAGNDTLIGGAGDDTLDQRTDNTTLVDGRAEGGEGNDTVIINQSALGASGINLDGGAGNDTLQVWGSTGVQLDLRSLNATNFERLDIAADGIATNVLLSSAGISNLVNSSNVLTLSMKGSGSDKDTYTIAREDGVTVTLGESISFYNTNNNTLIAEVKFEYA
jgi:Ca2+-binding RTX toxin-like protein